MDIPLGKSVKQPDRYDPDVLAAIPRKLARQQSFIDPSRFTGLDRWTAYEFFWLDSDKQIQTAILDIEIASDSLKIVESKSLKLYLNSCYYAQFDSSKRVESELQTQLESRLDGAVKIKLLSLPQAEQLLMATALKGICIDGVNGSLNNRTGIEFEDIETEEVLYSHAFRSLCPVTAQPDWASIIVQYRGARIIPSSFLHYLRGYAEHQGFHENCVEKIHKDILDLPEIKEAAVCAKFLRRGGIDICPFRTSSQDFAEPKGRLIRQ